MFPHLADDTHAAVWHAETAPDNTGWMRWIDAVEKELGHDVDGNLHTDGYSLDTFGDMWEAGTPVADAAAACRCPRHAAVAHH